MSESGGEMVHNARRSSVERYDNGLPDDVVVDKRGPCSGLLG
jgi:hypothetical protein